MADLLAAIAIDPRNDELHNLLGHAYLFTERYEEARAAFEESLRIDPDVSWRHARLGFVLTRLGDFDGALAALNRALELNPESTLALYNRARLYLLLERPDEAIIDFTAAIEIEPFDDDYYFARGQVYVREGDMEGALHNYRIAELLNPNNVIGNFFDERLPARTVPVDPAPVEWAPPEEGMRITYLEVIHEEEPEIDPMLAAINALVAWFSTPERELPVGQHFYTFDIGATEGTDTAFVNTDLYGTMERPPVVTQTALQSLTAGGILGDIATPHLVDFDFVEKVWPLEVGRAAEGSGLIAITCPDRPEPLAFGLGCTGDLEEVEAGAYEWTATVEGWEDVLTPAGRRLALRIVQTERRTLVVLGQELTVNFVNTWWYDPEINWWVKREIIERRMSAELGTVTTIEAIRIELPDA